MLILCIIVVSLTLILLITTIALDQCDQDPSTQNAHQNLEENKNPRIRLKRRWREHGWTGRIGMLLIGDTAIQAESRVGILQPTGGRVIVAVIDTSTTGWKANEKVFPNQRLGGRFIVRVTFHRAGKGIETTAGFFAVGPVFVDRIQRKTTNLRVGVIAKGCGRIRVQMIAFLPHIVVLGVPGGFRLQTGHPPGIFRFN